MLVVICTVALRFAVPSFTYMVTLYVSTVAVPVPLISRAALPMLFTRYADPGK